MSTVHAFLFPNPLQIATIRAACAERAVTPLFVHDQRVEDAWWMAPAVFADWAQPRQDVRCLPCHEVGIYFLAAQRRPIGRVGFSERCFEMLTKLQASEALAAAGMRMIDKQLVDDTAAARLGYPIVVKPNFGFASQLVKTLRSPAELTEYLAQSAALREASLIPMYRAWFDGSDRLRRRDAFLIEPYLADHTFLSVPFAVTASGLRAFPVVGERCARNVHTDFEWCSFAAPASDRDTYLVERELQRLVTAFALEPGVYECEMLLDPDGGAPWCLEFSPRITGGSIPQLVWHALGVDLERAAIALFLGQPAELTPRRHRPCRLTRRSLDEPSPPDVLERFEKHVGPRHYVDEVFAVAAHAVAATAAAS